MKSTLSNNLPRQIASMRHLTGSKMAKIFAILCVSFVLVLVSAPAINARGPIFNGLPGDQELLRGANSTQNPGSSVWSDPVSGSDGDAIAVLVYYHNIVEGTVARNTRISVILPAGETSVHVLNGKLWAANADAVRDTLTINSTQATKVEYIPGTTRWFPNRQSDPAGSGQALPDGITTAQGVNLGGIQGCWPYAGYVLFQVRLKHTPTPPPTNPNIAIEKTVSNITRGSEIYNWQEQVTVNRDEEVIFRLAFNNNGTGPAQNVVLKDILPAGLDFVPGSVLVYTDNTILNPGDGLFGPGYNFGILNRGASAYLTFRAKTQINLPDSRHILMNKGVITANGGLRDEDTASVIIPPISPNITKTKSAWNITQNADATRVVAKSGDLIQYHLITRNVGSAVKPAFVVEDDLSDILDNASLFDIANNGWMSGNTVVYPAVDIAPGQTLDYTFRVKVKEQPQNSDFEMRNVYGNEVIIIIERPRPPIVHNPLLSIEKFVRNVSQNETSFVKENYAYPDELLEYRLEIKNTGDAKALNVKLRDVLPVPVSYVGGTVKIILANGTVITNPQLFTAQMALGDLRPFTTSGDKIIITFEAKVNREIAAGSRIENKAVATADGGLRDTSFAYTNVLGREEAAAPQVKGVMKGLPPTGVNIYVLILLALGLTIGAGAVMYKVSKR